MIPAQVSPSRTEASLEGRVVSSTTGAPLAKATVTLSSGKDKRYLAVSARDGTFLFEDIGPGDYSVTVERVGYLAGDALEVSVTAGERTKDVEVKLAPQGVISGRVLDEDGDPVPGAQVVCYRWLGAGAKKHVVDSTSKEVDEEANFTFTGLKAGHYYVFADFPRAQGGAAVKEAFAATYYLNAADATGATPLHLATGTQLRNIDIHLRKAPVVRVRGKIVNAGAGQPWQVALKPKHSDEFGTGSQSTRVKDGVFEFAAVEPGSYIVETNPNLFNWDMKTGETHITTASLFGRRAVEVAGRNIDDLGLSLEPMIEISGKICMDGVKPAKGLRVALSSSTYVRRLPEAGPGRGWLIHHRSASTS